MALVTVRVEWRRGVNGTDGTYVFSPKPELRRPTPGKRTAVLTVPLMDGVVVQNFANMERTIELNGNLYNRTGNWDEMETARQNLTDGLGTGPGQLHLISPQYHRLYNGQIMPDGIQFAEQAHSNLQSYRLIIQIPDGKEYNVITIVKTIRADAEIG